MPVPEHGCVRCLGACQRTERIEMTTGEGEGSRGKDLVRVRARCDDG